VKTIFGSDTDSERQILRIALPLFTAYAFVATIFSWGAEWSVPLILFALTLLVNQVKPVEEIHQDVKYLRDVNEKVPVKPYGSASAFFEGLAAAVKSAKNTADLTHIRDTPPKEFGSKSVDYYDAVYEWVKDAEDRSIRRIVSVRNDEMVEWAKSLAKKARKCERFNVRVVNWEIDAPAINMAVIDGEVVFLALTGSDVHRTGGTAVEDVNIASYFTSYYETLWNASTPLHEFLAERDDH